MNDFTPSSPLICDHGYAADFLAQHDEYINRLAQKKVQRNAPYWWISDLDADELAQRVRIKLWRILRKQVIANPRAYIKHVVDTVAVDMSRHYKQVFPLTIGEEGELYWGNLLIVPGKGMQDPADELTQKEDEINVLRKYIAAILTLPPRQRYVVDPRSWRASISMLNMVDSLAREVSHGKAQALRCRVEDENRPGSAQRTTDAGTNLPRV